MLTRLVTMPLALFSLVSFLSFTALAQQAPASAQKPAMVTTTTPRTNVAPNPVVVDPYSAAVATAIKLANANDMDGSMAKLNEAIKMNPNIAGAYALRASLYYQKKKWAEASQDFQSASNLDPKNSVLRLNVFEIKFLQKQYDDARVGYAALVKDPEMGDFASYKVFLCDLFGGHDAQATKELAVFNDAASNPSYYFANAASDLYHNKIEDARSWLLSASNIYPSTKFLFYARSLRDLGYLPIPEPKAK